MKLWMCALSRCGSQPKPTRMRPTSRASASIDQSAPFFSFVCSVRRSFHVAGIAGSCHGRVRARSRMSAIQRAYAPRSSSVGIRSVVVLPLMVPPSAMRRSRIEKGEAPRSGRRQPDRELRAARVDLAGGDRPAVRLGDGLRDREPEAGAVALLRVLTAVEAPEEPLLGALGKAGA